MELAASPLKLFSTYNLSYKHCGLSKDKKKEVKKIIQQWEMDLFIPMGMWKKKGQFKWEGISTRHLLLRCHQKGNQTNRKKVLSINPENPICTVKSLHTFALEVPSSKCPSCATSWLLCISDTWGSLPWTSQVLRHRLQWCSHIAVWVGLTSCVKCLPWFQNKGWEWGVNGLLGLFCS